MAVEKVKTETNKGVQKKKHGPATTVFLGNVVSGHKVVEEAEDLPRPYCHRGHQVAPTRQKNTQVPTITHPVKCKYKSTVKFLYNTIPKSL